MGNNGKVKMPNLHGKTIWLEGLGGFFHDTFRNKAGELCYSKKWKLRECHSGKKNVIALRTNDWKMAVKKAREITAKIVKGEPVGVDATRIKIKHLFNLVFEDYDARHLCSKDKVEDGINHLLTHFDPDTSATYITYASLDEYLQKRRKEGAADSTIKGELAALRRGYTLGQKGFKLEIRGIKCDVALTSHPVFPTIKLDNAREGFFELDEFEAVQKHLPELVRPVIVCGFYTGWRFKEILKLEWCRVNQQTGTMWLEGSMTKNGKPRSFPYGLLPPLKEMFEKQRAYTDAVGKLTGQKIQWVFHRAGKPIKSIKGAWKKAVNAAGVPQRIFHDFRRTAATNLVLAGVPRQLAKRLTSHLTDAVFDRYFQPKQKQLEESVERLAAFYQEQQPPTPIPEEKKVAVGGAGNVLAFSGRKK